MAWFPIATRCNAPEYTMREEAVGPDDDDDEDEDGRSAAILAASEEP
jgi:hypothetical protein